MAYGLTIGTERANILQNAIQEELLKRELSPDADPVMAEYITIMVINDKTPAQITAELTDLIGSDFDTSFVDWLFAEVEKSAPGSEVPQTPVPEPVPSAPATAPARDPPPHIPNDQPRRPHNAPRPPVPLYQQAISQAIPSTSPSDRKRTRSTSPSHASKARRLDVPTGPRAMFREGNASGGGPGPRSLIDRVGPMRNGHPPYVKDEIQARIDNITGAPGPDMPVMLPPGGFPMNGMPPVDMNAMAGMTNPLMLQEMMMSQMALMSQMAGAMGLLNPAMMGGGFPMQQQGVGGEVHGFNAGMNGGSQMGTADPSHRGRGRGRGTPAGRGMGRGRGGQPSSNHHQSQASEISSAADQAPASKPKSTAPAVVAPAPIHATPSVTATSSAGAAATTTTTQPSTRTGFVAPDRPQSPTLCKFGLKCTNPLCRWSHPSPVATPESGVVLSNEACENGKNCKDKDCIKAHVSPAVLNPSAVEHHKPAHYAPPSTHAPHPSQSQIPCRFGTACTRPNCMFIHPTRSSGQPCRFGTACTRANCQFQHPEGRVLPSSFHRGLSTSGPIVNVSTPETGSMGGPSPHRSVTFNKGGTSAAEWERKVKEMEEKKSKAEAAVAQAKAQAASGKKDDGSQSVSIAA